MKKKIILLLFTLIFISYMQISYAVDYAKEFGLVGVDGPLNADISGKRAKIEIADDYKYVFWKDAEGLLKKFGVDDSYKSAYLIYPKDSNKDILFFSYFSSKGYIKNPTFDSKDLINLFYNKIDTLKSKNTDIKIELIDGMPLYSAINNNFVGGVRLINNKLKVIHLIALFSGRNGVTYFQLLSSDKNETQVINEFNKMINGFSYIDGQKYTDFNSEVDVISETTYSSIVAEAYVFGRDFYTYNYKTVAEETIKKFLNSTEVLPDFGVEWIFYLGFSILIFKFLSNLIKESNFYKNFKENINVTKENKKLLKLNKKP